jgi:hypothetical protein
MGAGTSARMPLDVRATNHPPYCKNKAMRVLRGDPVKSTIARIVNYPESIDVLENCCRRLTALATGGV